jgi:hypothetical protein
MESKKSRDGYFLLWTPGCVMERAAAYSNRREKRKTSCTEVFIQQHQWRIPQGNSYPVGDSSSCFGILSVSWLSSCHTICITHVTISLQGCFTWISFSDFSLRCYALPISPSWSHAQSFDSHMTENSCEQPLQICVSGLHAKLYWTTRCTDTSPRVWRPVSEVGNHSFSRRGMITLALLSFGKSTNPAYGRMLPRPQLHSVAFNHILAYSSWL